MKTTLLLASALTLAATAASATPTAATGYAISTFAASPAGTSGADSVVQVGNNVYVGYSNGTPKDGSGGTSTIVEYDLHGNAVASTTVAGHTDGLRFDPVRKRLWSMQNEDGNANLVLITPGSLAKSAPYSFGTGNHGGGYDDVAFFGGNAYVTVSNPAFNPNTDPALSLATLGNGVVNTVGVLAGNASARSLLNGSMTTLNLQDPDSLTVIPGQGILLDSQADGQLVFFTPGAPVVGVAQLLNGVTVDDTAYTGHTGLQTLLVADKKTNNIYAITGRFGGPGLFSAAVDASGAGFVGALGPDGGYTPIATGLGNPGGEQFLVPEPSALALGGLGLLGLIALRRRRA